MAVWSWRPTPHRRTLSGDGFSYDERFQMTSSGGTHSDSSNGRHERVPEGRPGRRGVIIGGAAVGVLAAGGAGWAVVNGLGGGGDGASDGGGGLFGGGGDEDGPTQAPRALESLPDQGSHVPDLATIDLSGLSEPVPATFPRVPGARGLSEAVDVAVNKVLREHVWAGDAAGELKVSGQIVAAGADVLGAAILVTEGDARSASVIYYRADGDRGFTSPGLIAPEQWAAFEKAVSAAAKDVEGLDASALATQLQEQPRPWGNGPSLLFDGDGALRVVLPAASVGGTRTEAEITVAKADVEPLLSEDGKAVAAAVAAPAGFDPSRVTVPGDGSNNGDKVYVDPPEVGKAARARESDGAGPVSQLAPLSGAGVRPSPVPAPDATRLNALSLTFDDGPSPELNQKLRDTLNEHRAAATFYMIGQSVHAYPEWCAKTAANGFEIGEHSWSHKQLSALSGQKLTDEVTKPSDAIAQAAGRAPFVMRPPYGARNDRVDEAVGALGQSSQIWDVDTLDWKTKNTQKNIDAMRSGAKRGVIALMHEIHPTSVQAVPQILEDLADGGFTLLTASEIGQAQMWAGKHYMHGLVTREIAPSAPASDGGGSGQG